MFDERIAHYKVTPNTLTFTLTLTLTLALTLTLTLAPTLTPTLTLKGHRRQDQGPARPELPRLAQGGLAPDQERAEHLGG